MTGQPSQHGVMLLSPTPPSDGKPSVNPSPRRSSATKNQNLFGMDPESIAKHVDKLEQEWAKEQLQTEAEVKEAKGHIARVAELEAQLKIAQKQLTTTATSLSLWKTELDRRMADLKDDQQAERKQWKVISSNGMNDGLTETFKAKILQAQRELMEVRKYEAEFTEFVQTNQVENLLLEEALEYAEKQLEETKDEGRKAGEVFATNKSFSDRDLLTLEFRLDTTLKEKEEHLRRSEACKEILLQHATIDPTSVENEASPAASLIIQRKLGGTELDPAVVLRQLFERIEASKVLLRQKRDTLYETMERRKVLLKLKEDLTLQRKLKEEHNATYDAPLEKARARKAKIEQEVAEMEAKLKDMTLEQELMLVKEQIPKVAKDNEQLEKRATKLQEEIVEGREDRDDVLKRTAFVKGEIKSVRAEMHRVTTLKLGGGDGDKSVRDLVGYLDDMREQWEAVMETSDLYRDETPKYSTFPKDSGAALSKKLDWLEEIGAIESQKQNSDDSDDEEPRLDDRG